MEPTTRVAKVLNKPNDAPVVRHGTVESVDGDTLQVLIDNTASPITCARACVCVQGDRVVVVGRDAIATVGANYGSGGSGNIATTSYVLKGDNAGNAIAATPGTDYMAPVTLATVATSGDYDDLLNKPTIPAAQVQSDWNEADNTKADYIKNKPSLATVATSGSYTDLLNLPTIPAAGLPTGGTSGQYLTKSSNTDYDVGWTTGGGGGISLLDVYPVGSIYMSVNSTDPGVLFGGTWQQIEDTFLLAAGSTYTAGNTGGSATVTLDVSQMPAHQHKSQQSGEYFVTNSSTAASNARFTGASSGSNWTDVQSSSGTFHHRTYVESTGGGGAHDNMPPYLVVYVWQRTA